MTNFKKYLLIPMHEVEKCRDYENGTFVINEIEKHGKIISEEPINEAIRFLDDGEVELIDKYIQWLKGNGRTVYKEQFDGESDIEKFFNWVDQYTYLYRTESIKYLKDYLRTFIPSHHNTKDMLNHIVTNINIALVMITDDINTAKINFKYEDEQRAIFIRTSLLASLTLINEHL